MMIILNSAFLPRNFNPDLMLELNDFYNDGFGWKCRQCERELASESSAANTQSRLLTEGEAESKQPKFSNLALAKWFDASQTTLICPRCGITERADFS